MQGEDEESQSMVKGDGLKQSQVLLVKLSAKNIIWVVFIIAIVIVLIFSYRKHVMNLTNYMAQENANKPPPISKIWMPVQDDLLSNEPPNENIRTMEDILPNPFNDDIHHNISQQQIAQAKTLKDMLNHSPTVVQELSKRQRDYYEKKYNISQYQQLPFCIIIPTFNNIPKKRNILNIRSVIMQEYSNFHIVVIDDASNDKTGQQLENYLKNENPRKIQFKVILNQARMYSLANIRSAARHFCRPGEVMMVVDGDDQLIGRQVFKLFNTIFQQRQVWFVYSNSLTSEFKVGYSRPYHPSIIEDNSYRNYAFTVSHLRAYYFWLFLKVGDSAFQDEEGSYFRAAGDMAACLPMLEIAHQRVAYLPELTYFYDMRTGINVAKDRLEEQRKNNLLIRRKRKYREYDNSSK